MLDRNALVVDDTPANRDFLVRLIKQAQFEVKGAETGRDALDYIDKDKISFDLAIVDMQLPDMSGLQLTQRMRESYPDALIVVATMYDDYSWIERSFHAGCDLFMVKPHGFMVLFQQLTSQGVKAMRAEGHKILDQHGLRSYRVRASSSG